MFTGIITHLGKLAKKECSVFTFNTDQSFCRKIKKGMSIAVNGTCLTALSDSTKKSFSIEAMPETLEKTALGQLNIGNLVNLELPATPTTFLSGHIVQGHVDNVSKLLGIKVKGNSRILKFSTSPDVARYIVSKGSMTVNGISLTVIDAANNHFTVGIIPYTWENTMLHTIKSGDFVNIEVDILAKYLERLLK